MEHTNTSLSSAVAAPPAPRTRLNIFERYLSLWVGLCMVVGVVIGKAAPGMMEGLRGLEFGAGSQINVPIAILIWLMITPMMMKVDFGAQSAANTSQSRQQKTGLKFLDFRPVV